jgi:hypothetical protein
MQIWIGRRHEIKMWIRDDAPCPALPENLGIWKMFLACGQQRRWASNSGAMFKDVFLGMNKVGAVLPLFCQDSISGGEFYDPDAPQWHHMNVQWTGASVFSAHGFNGDEGSLSGSNWLLDTAKHIPGSEATLRSAAKAAAASIVATCEPLAPVQHCRWAVLLNPAPQSLVNAGGE